MKKILLILMALLIACFFALVSCEKESVPYVVGAGYDTDNNLILEYSDGSTLNLGKINQKGEQGIQGEKGDKGVGISKTELVNGELIITYTDGTTDNLGKIVSQEKSEGTDGLEYYPLPDGTYAVSAGTTKYLEEIVIPSTHNGKGVSKILDGAFSDYTALKSVTIPDSVTLIDDGAFAGCKSLASVTIGDSVTSIGANAFRDCTSLTSVNYLGTIEQWCNILFGNYSSNPLYYAKELYLNGTLVTELVIPNTVTKIKEYAFYNCTSLTSITIPNSVTSIGDYAFSDCKSLASITIPNSVTEIGDFAFYKCTSLTSITIPDSVTSIGDSAFSGCTSLTSANYLGTIEQWCNILFGNYSSNPLYYAKELYLNGTLVTELVIPNTVTKIKEYAFYYCDSLTSVTIPDSVTSIGDNAFSGCTSLTSVTIPDSVTSIGNSVFAGCTQLTIINCEVASMPSGWSSSWNGGCSATVNWGYTGE